MNDYDKMIANKIENGLVDLENFISEEDHEMIKRMLIRIELLINVLREINTISKCELTARKIMLYINSYDNLFNKYLFSLIR